MNTQNATIGLLGRVFLALAALGLAFGLSAQFAHAQALSFTALTNVEINGNTYTIDSGSGATTVVIDSATATITVPSGSTVVFGSTDRFNLNNDGGLTQTCTSSNSYLTITGTATVVVTPDTANRCGSAGGAGGGGGGGSSSSDDDEEDTDEEADTTESDAGTEPASPAVVGQYNSLLSQLKALVDILESRGIAVSAAVKALVAKAPAVAVGTFTRDLETGTTGADVTDLQNFLLGKGYSIPAGATGFFGAQTRTAVIEYQKANGITPAVGYFGPKTRAHAEAHP